VDLFLNKASKGFFFEKKKQKTFVNWASGVSPARSKLTEVFWFFFSKKNRLLAH
jgi:hypothetical protein